MKCFECGGEATHMKMRTVWMKIYDQDGKQCGGGSGTKECWLCDDCKDLPYSPTEWWK